MKKPPKWSFDKRIASWFRDSDGTWVKLAAGYSCDGLHTMHVEPGESVIVALRSVGRCDATCGACADARQLDRIAEKAAGSEEAAPVTLAQRVFGNTPIRYGGLRLTPKQIDKQLTKMKREALKCPNCGHRHANGCVDA